VSNTQKIIVRPFKRENFDLECNPGMQIYYRKRGDDTYRRLTLDELVKSGGFQLNGRETILAAR